VSNTDNVIGGSIMLCESCDCVYINGIKCHEHGCPDAWKDYEIECMWCGRKFKPVDKDQRCCDQDCANAYE
jgi:hypothetical protein